MGYALLSHLFYKDKNEYKDLYEKRITSESTCILPIKIGDYNAFYCLCPEIHNISMQIMQIERGFIILEKSFLTLL